MKCKRSVPKAMENNIQLNDKNEKTAVPTAEIKNRNFEVVSKPEIYFPAPL